MLRSSVAGDLAPEIVLNVYMYSKQLLV